MKNYFEKTQAYKLVAVTDRNGKDKVHSSKFYEERINCIAINLQFIKNPVDEDKYCARMTFVHTEYGLWCKRSLHTSIVHRIEETENGVNIFTNNSIYIFEEAVLKSVPYQDTANLIELYLSTADNECFGKGFYYDVHKKPHELKECVHMGMFQDSVLIYFVPEDDLQGCVCRYFLKNHIQFYSTIYGQQDYTTPMLIHNTGKEELMVCFQRFPYKWIIPPETSKYINLSELERETTHMSV